IIKDCSFNGKMPCIGILFVNNNAKNSANPLRKNTHYLKWYMESSFNCREAILRCFTSYIQGIPNMQSLRRIQDFDILWEKWFKNTSTKRKKQINYKYLFKRNLYEGDLNFLRYGKIVRINWKWKNMGKIGLKNCAEEIKEIKSICDFLGTKFIVVDQTHKKLGFPAVRVIMPGISDEIKTQYSKKFDIKRIILPAGKYWPIEFNKFIIDNGWIKGSCGLKRLINEIKRRIGIFPYDFFVQTSGFYNRTINLFELLLSLYIKTKQKEGAIRCIAILSWYYPNEKDFYENLREIVQEDKFEKAKAFLLDQKGCRRFMLRNNQENPFLAWCDEACEDNCALSFEHQFIKLIDDFY
ncbi:MAG: YcaO-like family protein, partial [Candidatus Berkelbacteria bacterium]|nr:YcaO-like family protein [Candidatus Berkelbacteria bacterium]